VRACVCPSVDTLMVAFLRRYSPNWTQTCKPPKVRTSSMGVNIAPPLFHFQPKNPQFWGVNRRFQAKLAKSKNAHIIKTTASIPAKLCTVIKTTKWTSWVVPTHALQIQDGGKIEKLLYLSRGSSDFDEIWHADAVRPSRPFRPLKIWNFKNPRWRQPPSWKIDKSPYIGRGSIDIDEIWHDDAFWTSWLSSPLKI